MTTETPAPPAMDHDAIRQTGLPQERAVRGIGVAYLLAASYLLLLALGMGIKIIVEAVTGTLGQGSYGMLTTFGMVYLLSGIGAAVVGVGLIRLRPGAEYPAVVFAAIGILGFPFWTALGGYVLWLLLYRKAPNVFKPPYQEAVRATAASRPALWPPPHTLVFLGLTALWVGIKLVGLVFALFIPSAS